MVRIVFLAIILAEALACSAIHHAYSSEDITDSGVGCVLDCAAPADTR
jgi:hypothetical protein